MGRVSSTHLAVRTAKGTKIIYIIKFDVFTQKET